jgi:hypothetical protein
MRLPPDHGDGFGRVRTTVTRAREARARRTTTTLTHAAGGYLVEADALARHQRVVRSHDGLRHDGADDSKHRPNTSSPKLPVAVRVRRRRQPRQRRRCAQLQQKPPLRSPTGSWSPRFLALPRRAIVIHEGLAHGREQDRAFYRYDTRADQSLTAVQAAAWRTSPRLRCRPRCACAAPRRPAEEPRPWRQLARPSPTPSPCSRTATPSRGSPAIPTTTSPIASQPRRPAQPRLLIRLERLARHPRLFGTRPHGLVDNYSTSMGEHPLRCRRTAAQRAIWRQRRDHGVVRLRLVNGLRRRELSSRAAAVGFGPSYNPPSHSDGSIEDVSFDVHVRRRRNRPTSSTRK